MRTKAVNYQDLRFSCSKNSLFQQHVLSCGCPLSWHVVVIEMRRAFVCMSFENKPQAYAETQKCVFSPRGRILPLHLSGTSHFGT